MLIWQNEFNVKEVRGLFSIPNGWILWSNGIVLKITVDNPPKVLSNYQHVYLTEFYQKRCLVENGNTRYFFPNGELSEPYNYYDNQRNPPENINQYLDCKNYPREFSVHAPYLALTEDKLIRKLTGIKNSYIIISSENDVMSFELPTKEHVFKGFTSPDGLLILVVTEKEFIIIDNPLDT